MLQEMKQQTTNRQHVSVLKLCPADIFEHILRII